MIYERLKELYKSGKIKNLDVYVNKGVITAQQAEEIVKGEQ